MSRIEAWRWSKYFLPSASTSDPKDYKAGGAIYGALLHLHAGPSTIQACPNLRTVLSLSPLAQNLLTHF